MTLKVLGLRVGRPDYSAVVERVAVPTFKIEQENLSIFRAMGLDPNETNEYLVKPPPEGLRNIWRVIMVSADSTVLLKLRFFSPQLPILSPTYFGYQNIEVIISDGFPQPYGYDLKFEVTNLGDTTATVYLNAFGVREKAISGLG